MRPFARRFKFIMVGLAIFFLACLTINYLDFKKINSRTMLGVIAPRTQQDQHIQNKILLDETEQKNNNHPSNAKILAQNYTKQKNTESALSKAPTSVKQRYTAFDGGGFGSVNTGVIRCSENLEVEVVGESERPVDISYYHMNLPSQTRTEQKRPYSMVFTMESEVHSYGGESWSDADFRMWYNLDLSFPEPATYFDVKTHLSDLLTAPKVEFVAKETSTPIVWIVSNCNAHNGREKFMKSLMSRLNVDSYGGCLKNKFTHPSEHMKGNIELFAKYKFVIAIENSNCEDYVTEKLVHAVASGSIPIVAGKDNKPEYLKFMPKGSYINIYDFNDMESLAKEIERVASNEREYEKFIWFKRNNFTREFLSELKLDELIKVGKSVLSEGERFFAELVAKERSENKLCKIARYLRDTPVEKVRAQVEAKRMPRPQSERACLPMRNLASDFNVPTS